MMTRNILSLLLVTIGFVLSCSGCKPSSAEKTVVVYTALDRQFSEPIFREFERETGIRVLANYDTESTKTVGLTNRIRSESARPRCDVFWNNEILNTLMLKSEGLLEASHIESGKRFPAAYRDPEGVWYGFAARARILIVNKTMVRPEDYPRSTRELTSARWRGRVGIAKPLFGTTASHVACLFAARGDQEAANFFAALKANDIQIFGGNKSCAEAVGAGRIAIGFTDTDDAIIEVETGRPVEIIYPDDTIYLPNTLALLRGAPHRAEAIRLMTWLLSPRVENELAKSRSAQIPLHPDAKPQSRVRGPADTAHLEISFEAAAKKFAAAKEFIESSFLTP